MKRIDISFKKVKANSGEDKYNDMVIYQLKELWKLGN